LFTAEMLMAETETIRKRAKRTRVPSFPLPKRGFTLDEAAFYCGLPAKTIYEAMRDPTRVRDPEKVLEARARFPVRGVKRGKSWVFQRSDLDSWLDSLFAEKGEHCG